jgi:hypothetical protein
MKGRQLVVLLLLLAIPFFLFAAQQTTYMGKKVTYLEFPIAGGEKISVPVTDTGAIPAETAEFKIEAAGVALRDLKTHPTFSWGFALTVKSDEPLQRVKIERVYPDTTVNVLVDDQAPTVTGGTWRGSSSWAEPNPTTTPWLLAKGLSPFIFRVTIARREHKDAILYQLAVYDQNSKMQILNAIAVMPGDAPKSPEKASADRQGGNTGTDATGPVFDSRGWQIGYEAANEKQRITEFVIPPERVESWTELVTHQIVFDTSSTLSLSNYVDAVHRQFSQDCKDVTWSVLSSTDSEVTYEWSGPCAKSPPQYEMSRIVRCRRGLCRWAYATTRVPIEQKRAAEWRLILDHLSPDDTP